jgi:hypothetical protein
MTTSFQRDAGLAAIGAGVAGFLYSVAFLALAAVAPGAAPAVYSLLLLAGGLLSSLALVGLWERVRPAGPGLALWALVIGLFGALGSAIRAGYDLANAISMPPNLLLQIANPIDPRGLLTFGFAGIAIATFTVLMRREGGWPRMLIYLGFMSAALLVLVYLLRLTVPNNIPAVLVPAAVEGLVVNTAWYIWLGRELRRERAG